MSSYFLGFIIKSLHFDQFLILKKTTHLISASLVNASWYLHWFVKSPFAAIYSSFCTYNAELIFEGYSFDWIPAKITTFTQTAVRCSHAFQSKISTIWPTSLRPSHRTESERSCTVKPCMMLSLFSSMNGKHQTCLRHSWCTWIPAGSLFSSDSLQEPSMCSSDVQNQQNTVQNQTVNQSRTQ